MFKNIFMSVICLCLVAYSLYSYNDNKLLALNSNQDVKVQFNENNSDNKKLSPIIKYKFNEPFVFIKKSEFKLYMVDANNNIISEYDCALGKNKGQKEQEGDMKTPEGVFFIDEIIDSSYWTHDFKDGKGEIKGAYGPWFISINTDKLSKGAWGGIGIHGTHDENSIGTLASEGCIRLKNEDISLLKNFSKINMKVVIEN